MPTTKAARYIADMPTSDTITDEVKAKLVEIFGELDAHELAVKRPFEIREEFETKLGEVFLGEFWLDYVVAMLNHLTAYGFGQTTTAQIPTGPIAVTIQQEKPLSERSLSELLQLLVDKQGDRRHVLKAFEADQDVKAALAKTKLIIVPAADGGVNIPETVAYIDRLARPFGQVAHKVAEVYPVTIAQAFDTSNKVIINFVTGKPTYVGEADEFSMGLVFSDLDEKIIKAGLWGVLTGHDYAFRSNDVVEQEEFLEQLFQENLPRRMKRVIEDYERALASGDPEAQGIVYLLSEEKALELLGRFGGGASPAASEAHDEAYYEKLVRDALSVRPSSIRVVGHNGGKRNEACLQLYIAGHNHIVRDTIVLDDGEVNGHNHIVNVTMPPRRDLRVYGHNHSVQVTNKTWRQIAHDLGLV